MARSDILKCLMFFFFFFEILAKGLGISSVAHTTIDIAVRISQHMEFPSEIPLNKCPLLFPYMGIGKLGSVALVFERGQREMWNFGSCI